MTNTKYDLTIDLDEFRNEIHASFYTPAGQAYIDEVVQNGWTPEQAMANLPPKIRLGIRSGGKKKFVLVPPHSLH